MAGDATFWAPIAHGASRGSSSPLAPDCDTWNKFLGLLNRAEKCLSARICRGMRFRKKDVVEGPLDLDNERDVDEAMRIVGLTFFETAK